MRPACRRGAGDNRQTITLRRIAAKRRYAAGAHDHVVEVGRVVAMDAAHAAGERQAARHRRTLERALDGIRKRGDEDDSLYDIYRAACVKEFKLMLEQSGKLLRKRLAPFFASSRGADRLTFKDLFRHAAKHGLIEVDAAERWLRYRGNRNDTAHDHGERFAEATLALSPAIADRPHLLLRPQRAPEASLRKHLPDVEVWAYGSRASGRSHDRSELDPAPRGPGLKEIPPGSPVDFRGAARDSNIPFLVETHDWARLPENSRREIERKYVRLRRDA